MGRFGSLWMVPRFSNYGLLVMLLTCGLIWLLSVLLLSVIRRMGAVFLARRLASRDSSDRAMESSLVE